MPSQDRPRYELNIDVAPGLRRVHGVLKVKFTPNQATDRLVFRLWPNGPRQHDEGSSLVAVGVKINGNDVSRRGPLTRKRRS